MSNFTFTHRQDTTSIFYECEADTWFEALNEFVKFLRGAGYGLSNSSVGINSAHHLIDRKSPDLYNITSFSQKD